MINQNYSKDNSSTFYIQSNVLPKTDHFRSSLGWSLKKDLTIKHNLIIVSPLKSNLYNPILYGKKNIFHNSLVLIFVGLNSQPYLKL